MEQKSQFHTGNIYAWATFLLATIGCTLYFIIRSVVLNIRYDSNFAAASASLLILVFTGFALFRLAAATTHLHIKADEIIVQRLFTKEVIRSSEIKEIDLFARMNLGMLNNRNRVNGITLTTENAKKIYLPDLYYQDSPAIKKALFQNFNLFVKDRDQYEKKHSNTFPASDPEPKIFSGSFIFSFHSILFALPFIACVPLFQKIKSPACWIVTMLVFLLFFFLLSYKTYYFVIQDDELAVKNQLRWWVNIPYPIDEIKSVVIEQYYRQSNSLRINTTDFYSRFFQAGSLHNKTWRHLIVELQAKEIEVDNEIYV